MAAPEPGSEVALFAFGDLGEHPLGGDNHGDMPASRNTTTVDSPLLHARTVVFTLPPRPTGHGCRPTSILPVDAHQLLSCPARRRRLVRARLRGQLGVLL